MFWTMVDGKMVDPRDIEETPDMRETTDPMGAPIKLQDGVTFSAVERQTDARRCYICGQACPEIAEYTSTDPKTGVAKRYSMFLHRWCWYYHGGGYEAEKLSRRGR